MVSTRTRRLALMPQVDPRTAGRVANLRELAVESGGAAAQRRLLLDQDDFLAAFGRFERDRHPADAADDDEDGLVGCEDSADA